MGGSRIVHPPYPADDSVYSEQIVDGEVKTADIGDGEVAMADLANLAQGTAIGRPRGAGTGVPSALDHEALAAIGALVTGEPNGIVDRTAATLAWSDAAPDRTLTITPVGASYDVWVDGVKLTVSGVLTRQIADVEGPHYIYIDSAGALQSTQAFSDALFMSLAWCATVLWDATNSVGRCYEERHGHLMHGVVHQYLHNTVGARWIGGLSLGDFVVDGSGALATHAQCSLESGTIADEDIEHLISSRAAPASSRVYYRSGASGLWRWDASSAFPVKTDAGTGRAAYNEFTGGVWQQTAVSNGKYTLVHPFASADIDDDFVIVQGQYQYDTSSEARSGAERESGLLRLDGLPYPEMVQLGSIIVQTNNGYGNSVKSRFVSTSDGDNYIDWRGRAFAAAPGAAPGPVINPDGAMWMHGTNFGVVSGIWSRIAKSGAVAFARTAAAAQQYLVAGIPLETRETDNRGRKITSIGFHYEIGTAALNNVRLVLYDLNLPANGASWSLTTLAGGVDGDYDTDHDSAAKRSAVGEHRAEITVGTPAYVGADIGQYLYLIVDGTATGEFWLRGAMIHYEETLIP